MVEDPVYGYGESDVKRINRVVPFVESMIRGGESDGPPGKQKRYIQVGVLTESLTRGGEADFNPRFWSGSAWATDTSVTLTARDDSIIATGTTYPIGCKVYVAWVGSTWVVIDADCDEA